MKQSTCALLIATALLGACAGQAVKPGVTLNAASLEKVRTIAVVPMEVEYKFLDMSNTAREPETERTLSQTLTTHLHQGLQRRNFIIKLPDEDLPEAEKLARQGEFEKLRLAYRAAVKQPATYDADKDAAEDGQTLGIFVGKIAVDIAARTGADAILLVRYGGYRRSEDQLANEMAAGIGIGVVTGLLTGVIIVRTPYREGGVADMALIDGVRGEVIWTGRGRHALTMMGQRAGFARPWAQRRYAANAHGAFTAALASLKGPATPPPAPVVVRAAEDPAPVTGFAPAAPLVPISTIATPTPRRGKSAEVIFWESVRDSRDPAELRAYLQQFPNGAYAALARQRLSELGYKEAAK
jgi:hypothetical protein